MNYKYIRVWCYCMGSYNYYIKDEIARAQNTNAPTDAIYERYHPLTVDDPKRHGRSGVWARFSELSEHRQRNIQREARERGLEIELIPCLR